MLLVVPKSKCTYFLQIPPSLANTYVLIPNLRNVSNAPSVANVESTDVWKKALENLDDGALRLNSLREQSLFLPADIVDLSGRTCDKVGVSLYTWANEAYDSTYAYKSLSEGQADSVTLQTRSSQHRWVARQEFCDQTPGSCLHNQPNDLIGMDENRKDGKPHYRVSKISLIVWQLRC